MSHHRRRHHRIRPGSSPGRLHVDPDAAPSRLNLIYYNEESYHEREIENLSDIDALRAKWPVIWLDIRGLGSAEILQEIAGRFSIHGLAMEDVVNLGQRAKVEDYEENLFVVLRMSHAGTLEQVSLFLGEGFVLTFQEHAGDCFEPVRERIRNGKGRLRGLKADYLTYALIDAVIDGYFPTLDAIGDRLDALEKEVYGDPTRATLTSIQRVKTELRELHRAAWPQRDTARSVDRQGQALIGDPTRLFLRDCTDHATQVTDLIDTYREVAADLTGAYLSNLSNKTNDVMKLLTIVTSIFIPLGFLAGLYGMNFDPDVSAWNMPELGMRYGYPTLLGVMLLLAVGMLWLFKRNRWLG